MKKLIKEFREKFVGNDGRVYSGTLTSGKIETFWLSKLKAQNQELLEKIEKGLPKKMKPIEVCREFKKISDYPCNKDWKARGFNEYRQKVKILLKNITL